MSTISVAIMAKNEAHDIGACLAAVQWAHEIMVLDSGSTDGTQAICQKFGAKVINTDWPGFGEQSNRALAAVTSDWCLLLDADERVTPELKVEIQQAIQNPQDCVAYKTPRLNFVYGRALTHCLNPKSDQPTRLIKKGYGYFTAIVHPQAVINGKIGVLKNYLHHLPFANLTEILEKINSYSSMSAEKLAAQGKIGSITQALIHASWAFFKFYFLKRGFLDGWPGFLIAFSNLEAAFYRYAKLRERQKLS